jgi:hypothetical protein
MTLYVQVHRVPLEPIGVVKSTHLRFLRMFTSKPPKSVKAYAKLAFTWRLLVAWSFIES